MIAAAEDPHEFTFGADMMAWTLAMGHAMIRAGLGAPAATGNPTSCTPTTGWSPTRRSRWPSSSTCHWFPRSTPPRRGGIRGWVSGAVSRQVHALESWLVARIGFADRLFGVDAGRDQPHCSDPNSAEISVIPNGIDTDGWPFRCAPATPRAGRAAVLRPPRIREGRARRHRRAAPDPAHPSRDHADDRRRRHPTGLPDRAGPQAQGAQGDEIRRPRRPFAASGAAAPRRRGRAARRTTSRSASSRSRPPRPARRWSPPPPAGSAKRSSTA